MLIALLIGLCLAQAVAQQPVPRSQTVASLNKQFLVRISGPYYEGFAGDQEIILMDSVGESISTQTIPRRFLILPAVSDIGDVAITHREIKIFDKSMLLKGSYPFKSGEVPYYIDEYQGSVHGFSPSGTHYLLFAMLPGDPRIASLVCLTDSAQERWRTDFGNFWPSEILFHEDKIIVYGSGGPGATSRKYCHILELDGDILWKYETQSRLRGDWSVALDSVNGVLMVHDRSIDITIRLGDLLDEQW